MKPPAFTDSPEQAAVIGAPSRSDVLVVAGAGSGKTYTMTRRIIDLISRGVAPERILGLTFTRKAAGELLSRVSSAVIGAGGADGADGTDMDRMFLKPTISTYDAFFQSIVRQYGLLVGFDQNTQPLSEAGALQLVTNVIDRHMAQLRGRDLGAFPTLASRVLALSGAIGSSMIGGDVTDMDEAVAKVRAWDGAFARRVREALAGETIPETEPNIKAPKRLKKDTEETWAAKVEEHHRRLHAMCVHRCAGLLDVVERRETLLDLVQAYAAEKRRLNKAEFSDFTIAAYRLVTRFPSIGERCRGRFSHVLLDEYQDTSTTQAELLATLFHGEGTAVNAVGDPFQSIYAWRGASPGAFRMFQHDFHMPAGSKPYALSVTRRNPRIVLDAANDLTQPLRSTPRRPGSSLMREVDVTPLSTMPDAPEGTIGVLGYATLGQEIDAVVRFCRAALHPKTSEPGGRRKDGTGEPAAGDEGGKPPRRTAAVLFRSKKHMAVYRQALEDAGLRAAVVGYSAMLERPEIRDMTALLRVAADHTDSQALMRLLATPRFGLGAEDLDALAAIASDLNVDAQYRALVAAGIVEDGAERAERAGAVREHRDDVANSVFLTDVLLRDDLDELVERAHGEGRLSARAAQAMPRAGRMLRRVCDVAGRPLQDVARASCEALDLDIDTVVAQALRPGGAVNPTLARVPMDAVLGLTDTYVSEIAADATPTLRGFTAWLAALKSIEDETSSFETDREADVELMTVHQSKGLEWDAVAVVGLTAGAFPSSQGDFLSVKPDEDHPGGREDGRWVAPEYRESARTWLDDPTAVPVPVRADAGILPRFPHDMGVGEDPLEALERLDDVELIDDEVYGSLREVGDGVEDMDPSGWHLTQSEEYGRRLHADERRLMYVALTRAKRDALLTYSLSGDMDRAPEGESKGKAKPSNFWLEAHDSLHSYPGAVAAAAVAGGVNGEASSLAEAGVEAPSGFFAGECADAYARAVVAEAWSQPYERKDKTTTLTWPASLSDAARARLDAAARLVREAMRADGKRSDIRPADDAGARGKENAAPGDVSGSASMPASPCAAPSPMVGGRSLLERARMLVADEDLMTSIPDETSLDRGVKAKAQRILAGSRQSVTGLQARAGGMNAREERRYWRGIVRPIPSIAAPTASAGTRFHAWAERFIDAAVPRAETFGVTRAELLADLERQESRITVAAASDAQRPSSDVSDVSDISEISESVVPGMDATLRLWARRLASSRWAARTPAWAERQIVVALPRLDGVIANGKLDAVFHGGLDPSDETKRYTVIDWKTGRRSRDARHVEEKLVQLDLYRLLLSAMEQVPLDSIDAALYYVSEPDERHRELRAGNKTEEQIIAELSSGIPEHTDDD